MAKGICKLGSACKKKNIRESLKDEEVFMGELNDERGRELLWKKLPTYQCGYLDEKSTSNQRKEVKKHGKRHL